MLPLAYLMGSTPSAYIVARLKSGLDIRDEVDGKISAAAVYRRVGRLPFLTVVVMDISKAALAVLMAQWLGLPYWLVLLTGICVIAGHQWSVFLKLQGGLGATVIGGVLISIVTIPTLICAAVAAVLVWRTKKSTLSFIIGMLLMLVILFALQFVQFVPPPIFLAFPPPPFLIAFPVILLLMMSIKAMQIKYKPGANIKTK